MHRVIRWSIAMTLGGLITGTAAYAFTGSVLWGVAGLIGFGVFANAVARTRPIVRQGDRR
jgi:hypothetical protein